MLQNCQCKAIFKKIYTFSVKEILLRFNFFHSVKFYQDFSFFYVFFSSLMRELTVINKQQKNNINNRAVEILKIIMMNWETGFLILFYIFKYNDIVFQELNYLLAIHYSLKLITN